MNEKIIKQARKLIKKNAKEITPENFDFQEFLFELGHMKLKNLAAYILGYIRKHTEEINNYTAWELFIMYRIGLLILCIPTEQVENM